MDLNKKKKIKKVVAREFLVILICCILSLISFVIINNAEKGNFNYLFFWPKGGDLAELNPRNIARLVNTYIFSGPWLYFYVVRPLYSITKWSVKIIREDK